MNYSRFPSNAQSMLYTECDSPIEPTEEDIDEFARRIGIDPQTEPHLMHLARQGLMEKLPPDWKPCKDSHKDAWFYYNNKTHKSQWVHPMDEIYKEKVIQGRQDHAMNRIQSFDTMGSKPLKSLPPLKKGGGALNPITFPPPSLGKGGKLGPLRNPSFSSSDDISQFSSSQKQLSALQPLELPSRNAPSFNLNNSSMNGRLSSSTTNLTLEPTPKPRIRMEPVVPAPQPAAVKKSGLTLTGKGANFLKSAKSSSSELVREEVKEVMDGPKIDREKNIFHPQTPDEPSAAVTTAESSASETGSGKPLKSILSKSTKSKNRSTESINPSAPANKNMWDINPKDLTGEESDMWNDLDFKKKTSVKFSLEDPKLKFDFSNRDDTDHENDTENTEEEEEETEEDEEDEEQEEYKRDHQSDKSEQISESAASRPMSAGDSKFVTMHARTALSQDPFVKKRVDPIGQSQQESISKDVVIDRVTMKANIDKQVRDYQEKLEMERKEQESTIKADVEKSIKSFRQEMEKVITRTKDDLHDHKVKEIEKARVDMELNLKSELEKLRQEYKHKLEKRKEELAHEYDKEIKLLETKNAEAMENIMKDPRYLEAGKEYEKQLEEEIKRQKSKLEEEHSKNVENLKTAHKVAIARLKETFKFEEDQVKTEHSNIISEMLVKFDEEKQNLIQSFESEKDKIKSEFSLKASQFTAELSQNLETMRKSVEDEEKHKLAKDLNASKAAALKQVEDELAHLKFKYKSLEDKYSDLKQGINKVVVPETTKLEQTFDSVDGIISTVDIPPDRHDTTDSGAAESDTSYSMSTSAGRTNEHINNNHQTNMASSSSHRLNQALKALEELKLQIMEIKSEQKVIKIDSSKHAGSPSKGSGKKVHNATLPLADGRAVKARASRSAIDTYNFPTPLDARSSSTKDISDERNYVDEAKDFIKTQKYRLKRSSISFGTPVSTSVGAKQRQDYKLNTLNSAHSSEFHSPASNHRKNNHDHHLSETESSGVGSLKESSGDKSRISQDIEGILSSLQQLDGQMKYLWSVVGESGSSSAVSQLITAPSLTSRSPISIPVNPNPLLTPSGLSSVTLTESSLKYNLAPNLITPGNQALINSLNTVNSPQFRKSFIDTTPKPMISTLEDQIHSIKNRQNRIAKQYPLGSTIRDRSPSISERTKDLREWLEKF